MHVFKKSRKAKDKENVDPFSNDGQSNTSKMSRSLKRKNKNIPEPKPEFNLAAALPATNDFRTSLLMPGLSARFSMLKEQDDPNSMLGKASDDSVLFPKRASRLNLFSHNPLTDIAETESIRSIPKPFARTERSMSFSEAGYASDDGSSVMNRSRPGEGNNLFGGRQKVYHLGNGADTAASGKARYLYEDDVRQSPFQQFKTPSRDALEKVESSERDSINRQTEEADTVSSPMTAFSKNRGTQSSTTSAPSNRRTSTAATSVATCDSPIPRQNSGHAASKLRTSDGYEAPGVFRNPSSDSKKAFVSTKDAADPPPMPSPHAQSAQQPRSTTNSYDKYGTRSPAFSTNAFRANSPPPVGQAISSLDGGVQEAKGAHLHARRYQTASPTNQVFDEDGENVYSSNLQPSDRGKATAMGLFNRPRQQFDEAQFLQRQQQMHDERSASVPPNDAGNRLIPTDRKSSGSAKVNESARFNSISKASDRTSQNSHASDNTRSPYARKVSSVHSSNSVNQKNVKARVESLIRRNNAELADLEHERSPPQHFEEPSNQSTEQERSSHTHSTFINRFDSSDDEEEKAGVPSRFSRPKISPGEVHPALRNGLHDFDFGEQVSPRLPPEGSQQHSALAIQPNASPAKPRKSTGDDSPTLGPNGLGLSGMIRTHLRHDSDRSSIYPPQSPAENSRFNFPGASREVSMVSTINTVNPPASVHSDPWEFDNAQRSRRSAAASSHHSGHSTINTKAVENVDPMPPTMSQKAQQILGHAAAQRDAASKVQKVLGNEAPRSPRLPRSPDWKQGAFPQQQAPEPNISFETVGSAPWQSESDGPEHQAHNRNPSTDTQKERQAFDEDLAERRRKIQEGLKGIAERDRSQSPALGRGSDDRYRQPYERSGSSQGFSSGLRHKTSRGQMAAAEYSNKAMKMLGLNGGGPPQQDYHHQRPPPPRQYNSSDNEYDEPPRERERPQRNRPPPAASQGFNAGRRAPHDGSRNGRRTPGPENGRATPQAYANSSNEDFERARQQSATPNSQRGYGRDRAASDAAPRSQSRQRHYRDNDAYNHAPPRPDMRNGQSSSSPSPPHGRRRTPEDGHGTGYERSPSTTPGQGRQRSNSRPVLPNQGYFDAKAPPTPGLNNGAMHSPMGLPPQAHPIGAPSSALGPSMNKNGAPSPALQPPRPSPRMPLQSPALATNANSMPSPFLTAGPLPSSVQPSPATSTFPPHSPLPAPPSAPSNAATTNGRSTPDMFSNGRSTPIIPVNNSSTSIATSNSTTTTSSRPRRMTVNKNMISEPTFISSTSSVPLVGLPHSSHATRPNGGAPNTAPLIPAMNPLRRAGTPTNESPSGSNSPSATQTGFNLGLNKMPKAASASNSPALGNTPTAATFENMFSAGSKGPMGPPPMNKSRNRLRKISSEGGGMANKARQQALWAEREREERLGSAERGVFGSRSATNLNGRGDGMKVVEGGMF